MIALSPQFASLLVALTASTVGAAPNPSIGGQNRRYVVDVDIPGVAKVHMRPRASAATSRIFGRHHDHDQGQEVDAPVDAKAVYIQPPALAVRSADDIDHRGSIADPIGNVARRGLDEPIDQPDSGEEVHADDADLAWANHVTRIFTRAYGDGVLGKRTMFRVDSQYGPGLIITHAEPHGAQQVSRALATHELDRRGLLDPLMPILGSIPGIGGIIQLVGGTLSSVLDGLPIVRPILGGLILSPHPSASTQSVGNDTSSGTEFFLDASSSQNASTIYVVDSGRPTSFAITSQSSGTNMTSEHIVSLQMGFVNATSGQVQAYCATFAGSDNGRSTLAAQPCITDGVTTVPHASQSFGWNMANKAVRPLWNDEAGNKKRDYVIQAGSPSAGVVSQGDAKDEQSVVLLFEPFAAPAPMTSTNGTEASPSGKDATGAGVEEAPETSAPDSAEAAGDDEDDEDDSVPVFVAGVGSS